MASSDPIDAAVRQSIAAQIAARLPATAALAAPGAAPGVGESLKINLLTLERLRQADGPLADRVERRGRWHHQVYTGAAPTGFAVTVAESEATDAPHDIQSVGQSELPRALKTTFDWIDANVAEDARAQILVAPAFQLTAVWLHGDGVEAVVIADMPASLAGLERNALIPSEVFLMRLAENDPIPGLGAPD